jgi:hypothetical protein
MGKNQGFFSHVGTGFKAIVGSIAHSILTAGLYFLFLLVATIFGVTALGIGAIIVLIIISMLIGVFLLGWIYNKFWGWN